MKNKVEQDFLWQITTGEWKSVQEMDSSHIFNSLKMLWNHFAEVYNLQTVWFTKSYPDVFWRVQSEPKEVARTMAVFLKELYRRKDLPHKYYGPMSIILHEIRKVCGVTDPAFVIIKSIEQQNGEPHG